MAIPINIPKLGMTMSEATLVEWKASEGDQVERGVEVLTIETEKVSWHIEASASGFLHILVGINNIARVGQTVGLLAATQEELVDLSRIQAETAPILTSKSLQTPAVHSDDAISVEEKPRTTSSPAARRLAKELSVDISEVRGTGPNGRVTEADVKAFQGSGPPEIKISPLAKKIAEIEGVSISDIKGTGGTGGKITKADVEKALSSKPAQEVPSSPSVKVLPFTGMRRTIANNMMASAHNTAPMTLFSEADVSGMMRFMDLVNEDFKKDSGIKISTTSILMLAVSRVLKRFPMLNTTLEEEKILVHEAVNMGVAVALPEGLIVPVIKDVDRKGLLQIASETRALVSKARSGTLAIDDLTGGTFTLSNVSMFQVDGVTPILRKPETGLLAIGRIIEKPVVCKGEIVIRPMMTMSLTVDHQVVDGAPACKFLQAVARCLTAPELISV